MSALQLVTLAKDLSIITALVLALWGGFRGVWVWGRHYDEAVKRELWWRDYATALQELSREAVALAERRRKLA